MSKKVKVLVVDDSAFMRKIISDFINSDSRLEVVGTARNGEDAIRKIGEINPDVLTMDVEMPVMNGLEALKIIMTASPLPVVMLSSTTKEGTNNTLLAMQYGAIDFIAKPSGAISLDLHKVKEDIINKVYIASKANLKGVAHKEKEQGKVKKIVENLNRTVATNKKIVCIGTSTGGPRALQQVLTKLPKDINVPILIVQHMPPGFTKSLATRLDSLCQINVKEAEDGELIKKNTAYIAPGGYHLKTKLVGTSLAIHLDQSEPINGHRPSVDVMFESLTSITAYEKIAVIMTGMGADGARSLVALKSEGNTVAIAEAEESSIVFGMPKAAIATNKVDEVTHLDKIASTILKYL